MFEELSKESEEELRIMEIMEILITIRVQQIDMIKISLKKY